ncbi:Sugar phosphate permease [Enhydrobacter aerosaccus]|uniref:Sugar phosphate permease n=1 Tax=Enhydrobacter aerosaccus TaxID=225324 RepID=A0A1T4KHH7_9HYPH|nr:MFS transporter [Enhydrobacter aerosaccus]SJZ41854.1 Sugar phosphate permease [Enhydrobacter aerosaccus]
MTAKAQTATALFLRVFLPFAFVYFLSYIVRGVNAVIFPYLERDVGVTAEDLGLLTSAFFLFFAACQPMLGVALDRYGPRRLQSTLMAVAALGAILFALATSLSGLVLARGLIGLGFAGGLMAAMKAITIWYPPRRWGLITGFHMMAGGAGSMAATVPVEWSLSVVTWQGLFFWLAGISLFAGAWLFVAVPEGSAPTASGTLRDQFRITRVILTDSYYWRIQPLLCLQQLTFIASVSLWIGPWLRDVGGIADKGGRADILLYTSAAMTLGFAASGLVADALRRRGISDLASTNVVTLLFALVVGWLAFLPPDHPTVAWMLFGFLGAYPIQYFPQLIASFPGAYAGRVSTSVNLLVFVVIFFGQWAMGKVVGLWPQTATGYAPDGYAWAFGSLFILQLAALLWLLLSPGRPMTSHAAAVAD